MQRKHWVPALILALSTCLSGPAGAEVVMIVSAHSPLAPTAEQVCQAFLGKIKLPTPVNMAERSSTRDEFYSKVCGKDPAQVRAIWGKRIFTGTGTLPKEVESGAEMRKSVAGDPASIGYLDKKDVDASVKIVAIAN